MGNYSISEVPDKAGQYFVNQYDGAALDANVNGYVDYGTASGWSGVSDITEN